jgi:hypothetical protein
LFSSRRWIYKEDYAFENTYKALSNGFVKRFGIEELREGIIVLGQYLLFI